MVITDILYLIHFQRRCPVLASERCGAVELQWPVVEDVDEAIGLLFGVEKVEEYKISAIESGAKGRRELKD